MWAVRAPTSGRWRQTPAKQLPLPEVRPTQASYPLRNFHRTSFGRPPQTGFRLWLPNSDANHETNGGRQGLRRKVSHAAPNTRIASAISDAHLQLPERKIANGDAGRIFQRAPLRIEQAPISADRALKLLLPRFIIGLEQVDAEISRRARSRISETTRA